MKEAGIELVGAQSLDKFINETYFIFVFFTRIKHIKDKMIKK